MLRLTPKNFAKGFSIVFFSGTVLCSSLYVYDIFNDRDKFSVKTLIEEFPDATTSIEDVVYEQAKQTGKLFGYENQFSYHYSLDDSPDFVKKDKDDNWLTRNSKNVVGALVGKVYNVDLSSYFMLGYDLSSLSKEDIIIDDASKTIRIQIKEIQLAFIPQFKDSTFSSFNGLFRDDFSEHERKKIYEDAINQGILQLKQNVEEINKGFDMTNKAFEEILNSVPSIKNENYTLLFELSSNQVKIIDENQTQKENVK